jgi:DnaJ-class molecular chaperone
MNYFQAAATTQELKDMYRQLCKTRHPDKGGTVAGMQDLNTQYEAALARILSGKADEYTDSTFYRTR